MLKKQDVIIVGAGGHAKVVASCLNNDKYNLIGFIDKDLTDLGREVYLGKTVVGQDSEMEKWLKDGSCGCIVAIGHVGNPIVRNRLYTKCKSLGFQMINAIHPTAVVDPTAKLGEGIAIMPNVVINANATIGDNSIINTASVIEHDVAIGSGVHVAPRTVISGASSVGENTLLGAGSTIIQGVKIGMNSIVGAGTVVIRDLPDKIVAVGNPAKIIREV
jgi:UDP-perosamine 4-acetyltransferase